MQDAQSWLHTITNAKVLLGQEEESSSNLIYNLVNSGELELVKIGRRSYITDESIRAYYERLKAEATQRTSLYDPCSEAAVKARRKRKVANVEGGGTHDPTTPKPKPQPNEKRPQ